MLTFPTINATLRLSIPYEYRIYGSLYFIMILTLTLIHELIFTLSGGDLLYLNLIESSNVFLSELKYIYTEPVQYAIGCRIKIKDIYKVITQIITPNQV